MKWVLRIAGLLTGSRSLEPILLATCRFVTPGLPKLLEVGVFDFCRQKVGFWLGKQFGGTRMGAVGELNTEGVVFV